MRPTDEIKRYIRNAGVRSNPRVDRAVRDELLNELEQQRCVVPEGATVWRMIMQKKMTKIALAAVVIAAAALVINQFGGSIEMGGVAWADVPGRVDAIACFSYRITEEQRGAGQAGTAPYEAVVYQSVNHGVRMDSYSGGELIVSTFTSPQENRITSVMHSVKQYRYSELPAEDLREIRAGIRESIQRITSLPHKELGSRQIDGVAVEGIEVTDPRVVTTNYPLDRVVMRLWVSVETGLPVLAETETIGKGGAFRSRSVIRDFEWDVPDDAELFEPNMPADYTPLEAGTGSATVHEEKTVETGMEAVH